MSISQRKADSRAIRFCCPRCTSGLEPGNDLYHCSTCRKDYPIILGIPDFRVFPDPYIGIDEDRKKGIYLYEHSTGLDFEGLLRLYWSITPEISASRAEPFIQRAITLDKLGAEQLARFESVDACLEVGCATGGLLIPARQKYSVVAGVDIAFRWLAIAKLRFEALGLDLPLVCACANALPFESDVFDLIVANDILDHLTDRADQGAALREWNRVGRDGGQVLITTPNRYSLAPEQHVQVWGVGLLPRRLMKPYVRLVRRVPYEHLRLLSCFELGRLLKENGFRDHEITPPALSESHTKRLSRTGRALAWLYGRVRLVPVVRLGLLFFGPLLEAVGQIGKRFPLYRMEKTGNAK